MRSHANFSREPAVGAGTRMRCRWATRAAAVSCDPRAHVSRACAWSCLHGLADHGTPSPRCSDGNSGQ
jgi:hypothetical protein